MKSFIYLPMLCLCLSSCAFQAFSKPRYLSSTEASVPLCNMGVLTKSKAYLDDKPIKISLTENKFFIKVPYDKENYTLVIKDYGDSDRKFVVEKALSEEKWAKQSIIMGDGYVSAWWLLAPVNTFGGVITTFYFGPIMSVNGFKNGNYSMGFEYLGHTIMAIPMGIVSDVYNITIGAPSVVIKNPRYGYKVREVKN